MQIARSLYHSSSINHYRTGCAIFFVIFPVSGTIFKEYLRSVFRFSLKLLFETFRLSRRIEGDIVNVLEYLCKMPSLFQF